MATVTTAKTSMVVRTNWEVDPGAIQPQSLIPRGELIFQDSVDIPLKLAANDSILALTFEFAVGFVYRIVEFEMKARADAVADFDDWEKFMIASKNPSPGSSWDTVLTNIVFRDSAGSIAAFAHTVAGSFDQATFFEPERDLSSALVAQNGAALLSVSWADVSTDATAITRLNWRVRALVYDIDQYNKYPIHTPMPIISA